MAYLARVILPPLETAIVGLSVIAFLAEPSGAGVDLWRLGFTIGIGVFVTLVSVIYRDQLRRMAAMEKELADIRRLQSSQHAENLRRLDRATMFQFRAFSIILTAVKDNPELTRQLTGLVDRVYQEVDKGE